MNRIIFPLPLEMQGEAVADLQDGLQLLLEQGIFQLSDADRQTLEAGVGVERAGSIYLEATHRLVALFQEQCQLEPNGEVDEGTRRTDQRITNRALRDGLESKPRKEGTVHARY